MTVNDEYNLKTVRAVQLRSVIDLTYNFYVCGGQLINPQVVPTPKGKVLLKRWTTYHHRVPKYRIPIVGCNLRIGNPESVVEDSSSLHASGDEICYFVVERTAVGGLGTTEPLSDAIPSVYVSGINPGLIPNSPISIQTYRRNDNRIAISWFYNPRKQQVPPSYFLVVHDNATGTVNFSAPYKIKEISYDAHTNYYSCISHVINNDAFVTVVAVAASGARSIISEIGSPFVSLSTLYTEVKGNSSFERITDTYIPVQPEDPIM